MAIVSKSNQVLYTSEDYVSALQSANRIEKAVALVESGNSVLQFSKYIDEYAKLMKRVVSTNDLGHNINPNMRNAHYMLTKQIQGLEKRVVAACVQAKVLPPSRDLIQMLKIDDISSLKQVKSKWTRTDIAKYSALGGAAVLAYSQLWTALEKIPQSIKTVFSTTQKVIPQAGNAVNNAYSAAYNTFTNIGSSINALRNLGSKAGVPTLPPEDSTALGASTVMDLLVKQFVWKTAKPFVQPILPTGVSPLIETGILASTACDAILPGCTQTVIDGAKSLTDTATNHPEISYPVALGVGIPGLYYSDAIFKTFSSAAGFVKPMGYSAFTVPLATTAVESALKSVNPELHKDLIKEYPHLIPATNILGAAGSALGPLYYKAAITGAANGAAGAAQATATAAAVAEVAAQNAALLAAGAAQNAVVTPAMLQVIQKAADSARDTTLFRQRLKMGLLSSTLCALVPTVFTFTKNKIPEIADAVKQSATNGWIKQDIDYAKANRGIAATSLVTAGGVGLGIAKYRGNNYPRALGAGLLTSVFPNLFKYAGKGIYDSCAEQDGHCNQAIAAASAAVVKSRTDGLIKTAEDYANYGVKTAGDYVTASRTNGWMKNVEDSVSDNLQTAQQYAHDQMEAAENYVSDSRKNGLLKKAEVYTNDNPKTVAAAAIAGTVGTVYGVYKNRNRHLAIQAIADPVNGLAAAALTYGATQAGNALLDRASQSAKNGYIHEVSKAGNALLDAVSQSAKNGYIHEASEAGNALLDRASQSAKNGYIKNVTDFGTGVVNYGTDYANKNPKTSAAIAIGGLAGAVYGGYKNRNRHPAIQAIADPVAGLAAAALTYGARQAGPALWEAASQSATNGYIKDVTEHIKDVPNYENHPKTSIATAIGGIAGGVLGPLYYQAAIAQAGQVAFTAAHQVALQASQQASIQAIQVVAANNALLAGQMAGAAGIAANLAGTLAGNRARFNAVAGRNIGTSLLTTVGGAIATHIAIQAGTALKDVAVQSATDGYLKDAGDYVYDNFIKKITDYAYDNLKTSVASAIIGLTTGLVAKYKYNTGNAGAIAAGLGAAGVTHPISKGLAAARDATYQSATNGYLKDAGDYAVDTGKAVVGYFSDNLKTSGASAIIGLTTGLVAKYKYNTGNAGAIAAGLGAAGVTHPISKGLAAARDATYQSATDGYLKDAGDYAVDTGKAVVGYFSDNLKTTGASVITGIGTALVVKQKFKTGNTGATVAGLSAAGVTHPVSKAGSALWDRASQSATNGYLKDAGVYAVDTKNAAVGYFSDYQKTSAASVITGIVGGVAAYRAAPGNRIQQGVIATLLGTVSAVATHAISHIGSYVTTAISNNCADPESYCNSLGKWIGEHPKTTVAISTSLLGGVAAYRNRQTVGPFLTTVTGLGVTAGQNMLKGGKSMLQKGWNRLTTLTTSSVAKNK